MKDMLVFAAIFVSWVVLNRWVLPYFGVQTCMTGGCRQTSCLVQPKEDASSTPNVMPEDTDPGQQAEPVQDHSVKLQHQE